MSAIAIIRQSLCFIAGFLLLFTTIPQQIQAQQRAEIGWYGDASDSLEQHGFIPIVLRQDVGENQYAGVNASSTCRECEKYGIRQRLVRIDDLRWKLMMEVVDTGKTLKVGEREWLDIEIEITGRDGAMGNGVIGMRTYFVERLLDEPTRFSITYSHLKYESDTTPLSNQQAVNQILQQHELRNRSVAIYKIRGGIQERILQSFARKDSIQKHVVDSLCDKVYTEPLDNCFDVINELVSSPRSGRNFGAFVLDFAIKHGVDPDKIDDVILQKMLSEVLSCKAVRDSRPDKFYLVTTDEKKPKPIGIFGGRESRITGYPINRDLLDSMSPGAAKRVIDQLALMETAPTESDLVKLWPSSEVEVDANRRTFFPDIEAVRLIRGMTEFSGPPIVVYEIQEWMKSRIIRHIEYGDGPCIDFVDSLCQVIYSEPLADCFNTLLRLVSSARTDYGANFPAFKLLFAQNYGLDPDELDSTKLMLMKDSVAALVWRRNHRQYPDHLYFVTADSTISMVWMSEEQRDITFDLGIPESSDPTRTIKLHSVFTGAAVREQLDALYPGAADLLFRQLPGAKREDSGWEDIDLVRIGPVAVPDH